MSIGGQKLALDIASVSPKLAVGGAAFESITVVQRPLSSYNDGQKMTQSDSRRYGFFGCYLTLELPITPGVGAGPIRLGTYKEDARSLLADRNAHSDYCLGLEVALNTNFLAPSE